MTKTLKLTLALLMLALPACAASEDKVREDFEQFVAERRACDEDSECMASGFGCPLGCSVVFNREYEAEITENAEKQISRYERGGRSCEYDCGNPAGVVCAEGMCAEAEE